MPTNNLSVPGIVGIAILVILVLVIIVRNIYVVQQSRAYVVERLGAFHSVWGVGLHLKVPFIERVVKKVSLKEQVADFDPQPVITKDNVTMQIDTVIYFQITDPKLYTYGVEYPMNAIENLTACATSSVSWSWTRALPPVIPSTPRCVPFWTRPRTPGASRSTVWS